MASEDKRHELFQPLRRKIRKENLCKYLPNKWQWVPFDKDDVSLDQQPTLKNEQHPNESQELKDKNKRYPRADFYSYLGALMDFANIVLGEEILTILVCNNRFCCSFHRTHVLISRNNLKEHLPPVVEVSNRYEFQVCSSAFVKDLLVILKKSIKMYRADYTKIVEGLS